MVDAKVMRGDERTCTSDCTRDTKTTNGDSLDNTFAEALTVIAKLPLSDAERAEAVRRLLADRGTR
jgi:hypothetical protein